MREIPVTEVRAGDIARSNGKEFRVQGDGDFVHGFTPRELAVLGVTFWREDRELPDYPGAVVISSDGIRVAVRSRDWGESYVLWMTNAGLPWKTDPELLEWLGPDWQEMTTPPAREWTPVDPADIQDSDYIRFEFSEGGDAVEGVVDRTGVLIDFSSLLDFGISPDDGGKWFKREEQTGASE